MMTKQEVLKRYLRGDFDSLYALGGNDYSNASPIYWGMRHKGWNPLDEPVNYSGTDKGAAWKEVNGIWVAEGGKQWHADLQAVLKELGYVNT